MAVVDDIWPSGEQRGSSRVAPRGRGTWLRVFAGGLALMLVSMFSACSKGSPECPTDDGDPCTLDECKAGVAVNDYLGDGHPCFIGKLQGACMAGGCTIPCKVSSDCNDGQPCTRGACEGGACVITSDDSQTAPEDGNACTEEHCAGGEVVSWAKPEGSACGGGMAGCVGGLCQSCKEAADCGFKTECRTWKCNAGKCEATNFPAYTKVFAGDVIGDCRLTVCDGNGHIVQTNDPDDTPWSFDQCFDWVCVGTTPLHVPKVGQNCIMDSGLIGHCDTDGLCVQCVQDVDCAVGFRCEGNVCNKCGDTPPNGAEICGGSCGACIGTQCTEDGDCAGGHCVATNGFPSKVCCNSPCDGTCQHCSSLGQCGSVVSGQDPDTCFLPDVACANGQCKFKAGHACITNIDCVSNNCDTITKVCK